MNTRLHGALSFIRVSGATDLVLIILHLSPERTQSAQYNPHRIDTHCLVHRCALIAQTHTCASESDVALDTSALEGVILGLLPRQPGAAQHGHAHTSHLSENNSSSRSPTSGSFSLKSSQLPFEHAPILPQLHHHIFRRFTGSFSPSNQNLSRASTPGWQI